MVADGTQLQGHGARAPSASRRLLSLERFRRKKEHTHGESEALSAKLDKVIISCGA